MGTNLTWQGYPWMRVKSTAGKSQWGNKSLWEARVYLQLWLGLRCSLYIYADQLFYTKFTFAAPTAMMKTLVRRIELSIAPCG